MKLFLSFCAPATALAQIATTLPATAQDGALDPAFVTSGPATRWMHTGVVLDDDHFLLAGLTEYDPFIRMAPDGTVDPGFALNATPMAGTGWSILPLPDGRYVVGGDLPSLNGVQVDNLAVINADGTLDPDFALGRPVGVVASLTLQPDGQIPVGGNFEEYFAAPVGSSLMRISPDGTLDPTFNVGAGVRFGPVAGSVHCIVLQPDGKVLISGTFDKYNETSIRDLARLNPAGSLDNSFNPGTNNTTVIRDIELLPDGRILIAGPFTTIAGSPMAGIARLHPDGSLDTSFNIGTGCIGVAGIDVGAPPSSAKATARSSWADGSTNSPACHATTWCACIPTVPWTCPSILGKG